MSTPNSGLTIAQQMMADGSLPDVTPSAVPMRTVVPAMSTLNPDAEAHTQQLAQQAGVGADLARSNPDAARQRAVSADLDRRDLEITNPILARQLENPNFAGIAHDDLDSLSGIEQGAATMRAQTPLEGFVGRYIHPAFRSLMQYPLTRMGIDAVAGTAGMVGNIGSFLGVHGDVASRKNLGQRIESDLSPENAGLNVNGRIDTGNTLDTVVKNVAPMIPAMVASGGTAAIADAIPGLSENALKVLTATSVGSMFSADQGGATFTQMAGTGKSDAAARRAALLTAGLNLVPNTAMGLTDFVPFLERNPLLASLGVGGATGATGQFAQNVVAGKPWGTDVAKGALQGAAVQGGMHIGMGFLDGLSNTVDAVEQSKLRTRSPEAFQQFADQQFEGDASLRIPAQDFVNYFAGKNLDPAAAANQVGVTNLAEAAAAGSDLEIPKANFFGKLDPEHQKGLLPDVIDPSTDLSARQAEAGRQELEQLGSPEGAEKLARLQAEYAQADAETQATPEWQKVYSDLKQRYVDAGETDAAADGYATLQANAIANLARGAGLKPDELLALHNPDIVRDDSPEGVLRQSVPGADAEDSNPLPSQKEYHDALDELDRLYEEAGLMYGDPDATEEHRQDLDDRTARLSSVIRQAEAAGYKDQRDIPEELFKPKDLPARRVDEGTTRGWFRILGPGRYEIGKTKIGDLSTFIHEPAHAYLEMFRELTGRDEASQPLKDDFKKITEWLGTTPEEVRENGFTREQHEQWARANEQYVREGKAPSSGLQRVFHHFSVWLSSIYRRAGALGVELSPEIRDVMDRLYAGEEAVNRGARETGKPLFTNAEEAGWTPEEYRNYAEAKGISVDKAREQVAAELNEAAERERGERFREEKGNVREAVTQEIDARPEYTAIRSLRRGALDDGTELTLNREALVKQFGEDRVQELQQVHRGLYRNEGGTDAETAAEMLGFGSGEEMMRALESAPRRKQAIEAATRDYLTTKYGDVRYDGSLNDRARFAIENDERAGNIYREMRALRTRLASVEKKATDAKAAMAAITIEPLERYQEAARQMIENKAIADLQPNRYLNASRMYSREAFDALRRGDTRRAADAKNKELLNHFLYREAMSARDYADKFEARVKIAQRPTMQGKLGLADENEKRNDGVGDYRDQFNWLLARYKLGPMLGRPERSLSAWADDMRDSMKEPAIAPGILNEGPFADYRSVPLSEVHDLDDALENIRHLARQEYKAFVDGKSREIEQMAKELDEGIRANMKATPEKVFETKPGFLRGAAHSVDVQNSRMEFLINKWDGGERGPWRKYVWEPYQNSKGDEFALQADFTKAVNDAVEKEAERQGLQLTEKVMVAGIPDSEPLTRKELVSMALNMGNASNLDRLQKTFDFHNWDRDAIQRIGGMLKPEEWRFVQGVWDALKPYGQRMNALEKRLTGLPPVMVEVKPFKVVLDDGTEMDLDGGYYPVKYDSRYVAKGYEEDAVKSSRNLMEKGYGRATTSRNYTKGRTGSAGPLLLDYERVLTDHIAKATKDLSHREFLLLGNRLLLHPRVQKALRETAGPGADQDVMAWARSTANDRNGSIDGGPNDIRPTLMALRSNLVKASLGFKGSTSLLQFTHLPRLMTFTKPGSYTSAMVDFWKNPVEMTRTIRELSPNEMRFRGDNLDRDYRATLQEAAGKKGISGPVLRAAYASFRYVDHAISFPMWLSVYNDTLLKNGPEMDGDESHKIAMHAADSAVRMGMGTGTTGDLPPIMRSPDLFKQLETTLFGFENLNYNILRHKVSGDAVRNARAGRYGAAVGGLTYGAAMAFFVPAIASAYVRGDGPKDGENWGLWAAKRSLFFGMGTIPLVKDVAAMMEYGSDRSLNPMAGFAGKVLDDARKSGRDGETDWAGFGIDALEALGDLTGVYGTAQAAHTARYIKRANEGKVENPNAWGAVVGGR